MPWQTTWLIEVQIDFGVAAVEQRRREGAVVHGELEGELVEALSGHARLDVEAEHVEAFGGEPAGLMQGRETRRVHES